MKTISLIRLRDFEKFLADVFAALPDSKAKKGTKSARPLAEALEVSDAQAREWFITRRFVPSGPVAFKALAWLLETEKHSTTKS